MSQDFLRLQANVLGVEQNTSDDYDYVFDVTLDCGQPFKTATTSVGAEVIETSLSRPAQDLEVTIYNAWRA